MIRLRSFAFLLSLVAILCPSDSAGSAQAQVVEDSGTWLALFANGDIESPHSDRLQWWFDGHARFFDDSDGFGQSIIRPGIGYRFGESATIWAGYGWIRTSPGSALDFDEHRVWQQITGSEQIGHTSLGYRSRLEQRFLETGSDTGWRFRQLIAARRPIACAPNLTLVAWDEVFIHMNDTDWGADSGFDQNRVFVGVGFQRHPASPFRVETGYLNQYIDRTTGLDLSNHLLSVNLYWSP